jgi:hypothetical protein
MAAELAWWPMSPWLSPGAAWFIFFNVLVGAIAVMSSSRRGQQGGRGSGTRRRLARTASTVVLDSLRSLSIFSVGDYSYSTAYSAPAEPQLHGVQDRYDNFREQEPQEVVPLLNREPEAEATSVADQGTVVLLQSAPVAAAPDASATASVSQVEEDGESSISLDEAYALARARRQSPTSAAVYTVARMPSRRQPVVAEVKGRFADEVEGKAEVNARADQFIRQFREELKLERINSILNYTQALRRGAAATVVGCSSDRLV